MPKSFGKYHVVDTIDSVNDVYLCAYTSGAEVREVVIKTALKGSKVALAVDGGYGTHPDFVTPLVIFETKFQQQFETEKEFCFLFEITERYNVLLADRYKMLAKIGEGAQAVVYQAQDMMHPSHRFVAIKQLIGGNPKRFIREARLLSERLQHPFIVPVYEILLNDNEGKYFIVMEWLQGTTLKQRGRLPFKEALWSFSQIAEALKSAHALQVFHRDIKPENISIDIRTRLFDFGIAKDIVDSTLTQHGTILGTPQYMAPEMFDAELLARLPEEELEVVFAQGDVYGWGCTLYYALTECEPYPKAKNTLELYTFHKEGKTHFLQLPPEIWESMIRAGVSAESINRVNDLLRHTTDPNPLLRWKTMEQICSFFHKNSFNKTQRLKAFRKPQKKNSFWRFLWKSALLILLFVVLAVGVVALLIHLHYLTLAEVESVLRKVLDAFKKFPK